MLILIYQFLYAPKFQIQIWEAELFIQSQKRMAAAFLLKMFPINVMFNPVLRPVSLKSWEILKLNRLGHPVLALFF